MSKFSSKRFTNIGYLLIECRKLNTLILTFKRKTSKFELEVLELLKINK